MSRDLLAKALALADRLPNPEDAAVIRQLSRYAEAQEQALAKLTLSLGELQSHMRRLKDSFDTASAMMVFVAELELKNGPPTPPSGPCSPCAPGKPE